MYAKGKKKSMMNKISNVQRQAEIILLSGKTLFPVLTQTTFTPCLPLTLLGWTRPSFKHPQTWTGREVQPSPKRAFSGQHVRVTGAFL